MKKRVLAMFLMLCMLLPLAAAEDAAGKLFCAGKTKVSSSKFNFFTRGILLLP